MSKWINNDLFNQFQEQKKEEKENPQGFSNVRRSDFVWDTPERGTESTPKTYVGRFLPDKKGTFYTAYYYHMFRSGDKWAFILCPKTDGFEEYCPFCSLTSKLYATGSKADKKLANSYKRKKKFVGNFFIVDDPRDSEKDDDKKVNNTVRLYEFPAKVEMKLKEEITDSENGLGAAIFDPGAGGYDFILKVLATKKDEKGNSWPDYSNSSFARKPHAIADSDEKIEEIMGTTVDIHDYIQGLKKSDNEYEKILKDENVFDMVETEWAKARAKGEGSSTPKSENDNTSDDDIPWDDDDNDAGNDADDSNDADSDSDAELLAELDNM